MIEPSYQSQWRRPVEQGVWAKRWCNRAVRTWSSAMLTASVVLGACSKHSPPPSSPPVVARPAPPPSAVTAPAPTQVPPSQPPTDSSPAAQAPAKPILTAPPTAGVNEITSGSDIDPNAGGHLKGGELATPDVLAAYNKRLAMVNYSISDYPQNLQQLQKWPMMPPLPKAPPGKSLVYDVRTKTVRLSQ